MASDDHAKVEAKPEDVGDQALMRGLDTAFPFVRPGLPLSGYGRRVADMLDWHGLAAGHTTYL